MEHTCMKKNLGPVPAAQILVSPHPGFTRKQGKGRSCNSNYYINCRDPNAQFNRGYLYRCKPRNDGKKLRSDQAATHRWYFFPRLKDYITKAQFYDEVMNI